jgi:glycosyltransferase involved in cell wall biosynthesis
MRVEKFSLVVSTRNRTVELKRLLESLVAQTYQAFELIVVDQNEDDRLTPLLAEYSQSMAIEHVRSTILGHSAGSNTGLKVCTGDIVGFPDDDCWYAPDLLRRVVDMLEAHPEWHAITGCEAPSEQLLRADRFDQVSGQVTQQNIWRRHISFAAFFRKAAIAGIYFDERLGVGAGTIWGSGEETDFLLRFIKRGYHVHYEPSLIFFHPDWGTGPYTLSALTKARRYGMGMGRILQAYRFSLPLTLRCLYRPLFGGVYTFVVGRPRKAFYHWSIFVGRTAGWIISLISNQAGSLGPSPGLKRKVSFE